MGQTEKQKANMRKDLEEMFGPLKKPAGKIGKKGKPTAGFQKGKVIIANANGNKGVQVIEKKAYGIANSQGEFGAFAYESRLDAVAALKKGEHVVVVKVVGKIIPIAKDGGRERLSMAVPQAVCEVCKNCLDLPITERRKLRDPRQLQLHMEQIHNLVACPQCGTWVKPKNLQTHIERLHVPKRVRKKKGRRSVHTVWSGQTKKPGSHSSSRHR